jgi:hypothetical protein
MFKRTYITNKTLQGFLVDSNGQILSLVSSISYTIAKDRRITGVITGYTLDSTQFLAAGERIVLIAENEYGIMSRFDIIGIEFTDDQPPPKIGFQAMSIRSWRPID